MTLTNGGSDLENAEIRGIYLYVRCISLEGFAYSNWLYYFIWNGHFLRRNILQFELICFVIGSRSWHNHNVFTSLKGLKHERNDLNELHVLTSSQVNLLFSCKYPFWELKFILSCVTFFACLFHVVYYGFFVFSSIPFSWGLIYLICLLIRSASLSLLQRRFHRCYCMWFCNSWCHGMCAKLTLVDLAPLS